MQSIINVIGVGGLGCIAVFLLGGLFIFVARRDEKGDITLFIEIEKWVKNIPMRIQQVRRHWEFRQEHPWWRHRAKEAPKVHRWSSRDLH